MVPLLRLYRDFYFIILSGLPAVETVCRPNLVLPRKIHGAALAALVDWMYTGKLTVHRKALGHLPLVANYLKVNIKLRLFHVGVNK